MGPYGVALGDIVISVEGGAGKPLLGHSFEREITFLSVHGMHICLV